MKVIPVETIQGGEILAKDIYLDNGVILMSQGTMLRTSYIDRLLTMGHDFVYVVDEEIQGLIDCSTEQVIQKQCQESVRNAIEKYSYDVDAELASIVSAADDIVRQVLSQPDVLYNLSRIRDKSLSTYLHSINVAALSVLIGVKMRMQERRIKNMAIGALLHDIGLIYVPLDMNMVNIDTCNDQVLKEVKRHVIYGYSAVEKESWLPMSAKDIIVNHHERIDASGYPFHLTKDKISLETKIVSLCDEFDSIVYGNYRNRHKIKETIDYITSSAGIQFEFKVVQTFLASVAVYPIGSIVQTDSGSKGVVIRQNRGMPTRPVLRMVSSSKVGEFDTEKELDLSTNLSVMIMDTVEM